MSKNAESLRKALALKNIAKGLCGCGARIERPRGPRGGVNPRCDRCVRAETDRQRARYAASPAHRARAAERLRAWREAKALRSVSCVCGTGLAVPPRPSNAPALGFEVVCSACGIRWAVRPLNGRAWAKPLGIGPAVVRS